MPSHQPRSLHPPVSWPRYSTPFHDELFLSGKLNDTSLAGDEGFDAWFAQWLASIQHLLPMLIPPIDADGHVSTPMLGLDDIGSVVPYAEATAPPLPPHPMPSAEYLPHVLTPEAAASSNVPSAVAAAAAAFKAQAAAAAARAAAGEVPPADVANLAEQEVFEFSREEFERGDAAAQVKAALHAYALRAGAAEPVQIERDPDAGESFFAPSSDSTQRGVQLLDCLLLSVHTIRLARSRSSWVQTCIRNSSIYMDADGLNIW